jgi:L,D-transpeptidase catalytic domain
LLRCVGREPATSDCGRRGLGALRQALAAGMALAVLSSLTIPAEAASRRFRDTAAKSQRFGFGELPPGPLQLVVSIHRQQVTLYSNGHRVTQVPVSTGTPGHPTPKGIFSVIEKDRWHRSNLYDNAPMYFMHRLTWSGVAMHEGMLPGVPASHGCIRLPREFAARLWAVSKLGVRVVVSGDDVVPEDFAHPKLFVHTEKPAEAPAPGAPEVLFDSLRPSLSELNVPPGEPIKLVSAATRDQLTPELNANRPVLNAIPVPSSEPGKTAEPPKRSGQVAVFVSRREKKIFVRQGFMPLFEMPVEIANPDQPLGTHLFTALELQDGGHMRWNAVTIASRDDGAPEHGKKRGRKASVARALPATPAPSAAEALERIRFPQDALDRIGEVLVPGSSLIISDLGLGTETGRFTEFIVVTR